MPTIIDKTNRLIEDKNNNLLPKNLREGITALGVTGRVKENFPQIKTIAPTIEDTNILPDKGFNNFSKVYIDRVSDKIDPNFISENIKYGVRIFGKAGTLLKEPFIIQNKIYGITRNGTTIVRKDPEYDTMGSIDLYVCVLTGVQGPNGVPTSDANAEASDIAQGKIAFSKGRRLVGEIPDRKGKINLGGFFRKDEEKKECSFESSSNRKLIIRQDTSLENEKTYKDLANNLDITPKTIAKGHTILDVVGDGEDKTAHFYSGKSTDSALYNNSSQKLSWFTEKIGENPPHDLFLIPDYYRAEIFQLCDKIIDEMNEKGLIIYGSNKNRIFHKGEFVSVKRFGDWHAKEHHPYIKYELDHLYADNFNLKNIDAYGYVLDAPSEEEPDKLIKVGLFLISQKLYENLKPVIATFDYSEYTPGTFSEFTFMPKSKDKKSLITFSEKGEQKIHFPNISSVEQELLDELVKKKKEFNMTSDNLYILPDLKFKFFDKEAGISRHNDFSHLFSGCNNLKKCGKIIIEGKVLDGPYHFEEVFSNCKNLKEIGGIEIERGDIDISKLFKGCKELETVNFFTRVPNRMYQCFSDCQKLKTVSFPEGVSNTIEDASHAFSNCSELEQLKVKNIVVNYGYEMFNNCKKLDFSNVKISICVAEEAFLNCKKLTDEVLSNIDCSNTEYATRIFKGCSLSNPIINFPKIKEINDWDDLFSGTLTFKEFGTKTNEFFSDPTATIDIYGMFYSSKAEQYWDTTPPPEAYEKMPKVKEIIFENFVGDNPNINSINMAHSFSGSHLLKQVKFVKYKKGLRLDMKYAFFRCEELAEIPNIVGDSVIENLSCAFVNCKKLTNANILGRLKSVHNIEDIFWGCTSLETFPKMDLSAVKVMRSAFRRCPSLSDESLDNILYSCSTVPPETLFAEGEKTLYDIGLSKEQVMRCHTLPSYSLFLSAGWQDGKEPIPVEGKEI